MKKYVMLFLSFIILSVSLVSCGSSKNNNENKIYNIGQEAFIKDKNGKDIYSIRIDSIKKVDDFEYKDSLKGSKEIIEITYTYKNLNKEDKPLYIHGAELQVTDKDGTLAKTSDMFPKGAPEKTKVGANCIVNAYYGLSNISNSIKITFTSKQYKTKIEFEGNIEES